MDLRVGDRASPCGGAMRPVAVWSAPDGEWRVLHRCERCATIKANRIGPDDSEAALLSLAARPLANTPFVLKGRL